MSPLALSEEEACCFVIITSYPHDWGGSEELWHRTALHLLRAGHAVHVFKARVPWMHPRIVQLLAAGCRFTALGGAPPAHLRLLGRVLPSRWHIWQPPAERLLRRALRLLRPQLVLVSQGGNLEGVDFADFCRRLAQPYALLAHKATDIFLAHDGSRQRAQQAYQAARHCFFAAHHTLELTQLQLALPLPQASVVATPVNVPLASPLPPPAPTGTWHLACVGRLDILAKGQDVLLRVLARPHWRARPLHVTFYGTGPHRQALAEMADYLGVAGQVSFAGQVADVLSIWQASHALVLPARFAGLPLSLAEAMLCGRPAIATDVGDIAELLLDNITGFLAAEPSPAAFDEALERAWARRAEWPRLGAQAARHARATLPADAAADFGQQLLGLARGLPAPAVAVAV